MYMLISNKLFLQWFNTKSYRDPNTGKKVDVEWPKYDNNKSHLELKSEIVVSSALKADKQQFFMQLLESWVLHNSMNWMNVLR